MSTYHIFYKDNHPNVRNPPYPEKGKRNTNMNKRYYRNAFLLIYLWRHMSLKVRNCPNTSKFTETVFIRLISRLENDFMQIWLM